MSSLTHTLWPGRLNDATEREKRLSDPRWAGALFGVAGTLLAPCVVVLLLVLPSTHKATHWDVAWAGFDVLLAASLLAVAVSAWTSGTVGLEPEDVGGELI